MDGETKAHRGEVILPEATLLVSGRARIQTWGAWLQSLGLEPLCEVPSAVRGPGERVVTGTGSSQPCKGGLPTPPALVALGTHLLYPGMDTPCRLLPVSGVRVAGPALTDAPG